MLLCRRACPQKARVGGSSPSRSTNVQWRNGSRGGFRIRCRKAWGFESPLDDQLRVA